jgi:predicted class III extradiol MEMO1 family dioxygenase
MHDLSAFTNKERIMATSTMTFKSHSLAHEAWVAIEHAAVVVRTAVSDFCHYLAQSAEAREHARDDAYLAEAVDCYDLEYRMRELDRGRTSPIRFG